jgi:pyrroloquinoline quinone biosynthesis protein D
VKQAPAKATDRFAETVIDDEIVVMNIADGSFFSLTGAARAIWQLIDGKRDRAALLAALAQDYPAAEAAMAADLDAFLLQLEAAGLIVTP